MGPRPTVRVASAVSADSSRPVYSKPLGIVTTTRYGSGGSIPRSVSDSVS